VVGAWLTTWLNAEDVPAEKTALPPYTAVMEWVPMLKFALVKVATPPVSEAVPKAVLPFTNVTKPLGVPAEDDTVAVKVTDCP
jgi:hypothetical protein